MPMSQCKRPLQYKLCNNRAITVHLGVSRARQHTDSCRFEKDAHHAKKSSALALWLSSSYRSNVPFLVSVDKCRSSCAKVCTCADDKKDDEQKRLEIKECGLECEQRILYSTRTMARKTEPGSKTSTHAIGSDQQHRALLLVMIAKWLTSNRHTRTLFLANGRG